MHLQPFGCQFESLFRIDFLQGKDNGGFRKKKTICGKKGKDTTFKGASGNLDNMMR